MSICVQGKFQTTPAVHPGTHKDVVTSRAIRETTANELVKQ